MPVWHVNFFSRREKMERHAHQSGIDNPPVLDLVCEVFAAEVAQPRPQADVGRRRKLSL